jgi:hypothetical protein
MTPAARTLQLLRRHGYQAAVVERWIPQAGKRVDLFGCIDVIAVKPGEPVLGVQATTLDHVAHRLAKARALPQLAAWLAVANFQVWGWGRRGKTWAIKRVEVRAETLEPVVIEKPRRRGRRPRQRGLFDEDGPMPPRGPPAPWRRDNAGGRAGRSSMLL